MLSKCTEKTIDAISYAKTHSNRAIAKRFNVDEPRIKKWKQKYDEHAITQKKKVGVCKKDWQAVEENLMIKTLKKKYWAGFMIMDLHENMLRVSRKLIVEKARKIYGEGVADNPCVKEEFAASWGWLERFMKRNCSSLRRRTDLKKIRHML